ncbi:MAG: hypothetical protein DRI40_04425 [Chloroflexi bacterium]|nr:MAG: hypothetical protein DRI40_04425 [Chloroflexota bacterium]
MVSWEWHSMEKETAILEQGGQGARLTGVDTGPHGSDTTTSGVISATSMAVTWWRAIRIANACA